MRERTSVVICDDYEAYLSLAYVCPDAEVLFANSLTPIIAFSLKSACVAVVVVRFLIPSRFLERLLLKFSELRTMRVLLDMTCHSKATTPLQSLLHGEMFKEWRNFLIQMRAKRPGLRVSLKTVKFRDSRDETLPELVFAVLEESFRSLWSRTIKPRVVLPTAASEPDHETIGSSSSSSIQSLPEYDGEFDEVDGRIADQFRRMRRAAMRRCDTCLGRSDDRPSGLHEYIEMQSLEHSQPHEQSASTHECEEATTEFIIQNTADPNPQDEAENSRNGQLCLESDQQLTNASTPSESAPDVPDDQKASSESEKDDVPRNETTDLDESEVDLPLDLASTPECEDHDQASPTSSTAETVPVRPVSSNEYERHEMSESEMPAPSESEDRGSGHSEAESEDPESEDRGRIGHSLESNLNNAQIQVTSPFSQHDFKRSTSEPLPVRFIDPLGVMDSTEATFASSEVEVDLPPSSQSSNCASSSNSQDGTHPGPPPSPDGHAVNYRVHPLHLTIHIPTPAGGQQVPAADDDAGRISLRRWRSRSRRCSLI